MNVHLQKVVMGPIFEPYFGFSRVEPFVAAARRTFYLARLGVVARIISRLLFIWQEKAFGKEHVKILSITSYLVLSSSGLFLVLLPPHFDTNEVGRHSFWGRPCPSPVFAADTERVGDIV